MVGKRARSPDISPWEQHVGKRVTFKVRSDKRTCDGIVSDFQPGGSDGQAKVMVLHPDGLLRRWKAADIEFKSELSDKPFSQADLELRKSARPARGGTTKGQEMIQNGQLQGNPIHVWNEDSMQWEVGNVIEAVEGGKFHVTMGDGNVELDLAKLVWKVGGESAADVLKSEKDLIVLDDPSIPVLVTQQPSSKKMHVYIQTKHCSQGASPKVFATPEAIHVHDSSDDGQSSRDVVVVLQAHQQCDTEETVEAVLDKEKWLRVTFRTLV
eukprot:jgi/Ulvmu1/10147/UM006_0101.1